MRPTWRAHWRARSPTLPTSLLSLQDLSEVHLWTELLAQLGIVLCTEMGQIDRHRLIRTLIGWGVTDAVQATSQRLSAEGIDSVARLRARGRPIIGFAEEAGARIRELKGFLYRRLYRHWRVMRMAAKAQRVLEALFHTYTEEPGQLPEAVQARLDAGGDGLERIVCDYIAGMTDRFALEEYARLFDPTVRV
jgi:dGTPase